MEYKVIGKVLNAHGIKGELKVQFFSHDSDWHQKMESLKINDCTYPIELIRKNKTFWILKLEGITDRNVSESMRGMDIKVSKAIFTTESDEEPYLSELHGFKVILKSDEGAERLVGLISSFQETQAHFSIVIDTLEGHFEVPYVDAFIVKVDKENEKVVMNFPEDLLSADYKIKEKL